MPHWELPAIAVLLAVAARPDTSAIPLVALAAVTPALCAFDVRHHRLPDRMVLPGYLAGAAAVVASWAAEGAFPLVPVLAALASTLFLLLLSLGGGMGMGDVKLGGVLGLAAGSIGLEAAMLTPLAGFLLGGVAAAIAVRRGAGTRIPFGPYLLGGFWFAAVLLR